MARRAALVALVIALLFLAAGGLFGGVSMLLDPSGAALGMDAVLPQLPVASFVLPGLFLITCMGVAPIVLAYGLVVQPSWPGAATLQPGGRPWSPSGALALGLLLGAWLTLQAALIGFRWPVQYVTAVNAVAIVALALSVRRLELAEKGDA